MTEQIIPAILLSVRYSLHVSAILIAASTVGLAGGCRRWGGGGTLGSGRRSVHEVRCRRGKAQHCCVQKLHLPHLFLSYLVVVIL